MEERRKGSWVASVCSVVYLLVAVSLLLGVCRYCYPAAGQWMQDAIAGAADSPVREAFGVLADGLEAGEPLKDAAQASFSVLVGDAD